MNKTFSKKIAILFFVFIFASAGFLVMIVSAGAGLENAVASIFSADTSEDGEFEENTESQVNAKYVGVDDTPTEFSKQIIKSVRRWSSMNNPYYNGYGDLCEKWCYDVYNKAGFPYAGSCCAYRHGVNMTIKEGKIPKGALIFSGRKPDGTYYENGHRPSAECKVCGHYAGHVGIYIGDGKVAASQVPFIYNINTWIEVYGYGGYSLS